MLSKDLTEKVNTVLSKYLGKEGKMDVLQSISGGSINKCYQLGFGSQSFFLKLNDASLYPQMFYAEAAGLKIIEEATKIAVPKVVAQGETGGEQFLILQWVERGAASSGAQSALGVQLAELHKCSNTYYGLDHDNYMGSLVQRNGKYNSVSSFFVEQRLVVQVEIALNKGLIDGKLGRHFDLLFRKVKDIIPEEVPALVHGDLWSGNYMISAESIPYLIDPAATYSHREVDIAMTQLFGGFHPNFYHSYQECFPLEKGWEDRVAFWNLYPLLVHLNLFGRGYLHEVRSCLKAWI